MSNFDEAISFVLKNEKGLSENNASDKGGITNFGISLRFLKTLSPKNLRSYAIFEQVTEQTIRDLSLDQAKKIYYGEFWVNAAFDKILLQDQCNYIFDMAINMGIAPAIKCTQRACWSVMRKRDLLDDGVLGDKTLSTIQLCGFMLMPAIRSERAGYYRLIAEHDSSQNEELQGWLNRAYQSN